MAELNVPICAVNGTANTGIPACTFTPGKLIGMILVPKGFVATKTDLVDFVKFLQDKTLAANKLLQRIYPIFRINLSNDNSTEVGISTIGYDTPKIGKEGKYDWTFALIEGGYCVQHKLRYFNKLNFKALFVDDNNNIIGTKSADGLGLTGIALDYFYAAPFKIADASNATLFTVRVAISNTKDLADNIAFAALGQSAEDSLKGIIDLEISQVAVASGKATVSIKTACDKINMYDLYADKLASASLWNVTKNGVKVTITSVAKNEASKSWDISFTGTGAHVITLTDPTSLSAIGIGGYPDNGYEANSLIVTMQ